MLPASSERGCDCTWSDVLQWGGKGHCWNPDREWCYLVFWCTSRVPTALIKQILRKALGYCLSGISFNGFCHSPPPFSHPTTLGAFREELDIFITYVIVCVYTKYCMKYRKTDIHNIMSGDFFAMIIIILAICVCYLYVTFMLACYHHLSQMLLFKEVSSLFWPYHCKRGIHFILSQAQVHCPAP